jgi:hypothetical protein
MRESVGFEWKVLAALGMASLMILGVLANTQSIPRAAATSPPSAPNLGTAISFGVLAGSAVTNAGHSIVVGNLGVSPGIAVTGFPPGTATGTTNKNDAVAVQAESDLASGYNAIAADSCSSNLTGKNLGGLTLTPGVYCFSAAASLTGTLTLNAQGNNSGVFIFQIGSALTTASSSSVVMTTGGNACDVFWQVGSSAVLGANTAFTGDILALASVVLGAGANVNGSALARNGAVTLNTNQVVACNPVVNMPFGETHADCVHGVPNGSTMIGPNQFREPDGTILSFSSCPDPLTTKLPACGPNYATDTTYTTSGSLGEISAEWTVPSNPPNPDSNDIFYLWDGLLGGTTYSGCAYVIQPVIQWGYNSRYGGAYYTMATWYINDNDNNVYYSSPVGIFAGDSITGYAQSDDDCTNGVCTGWSLQISDTTQSTNTGFTCNDDSDVCGQIYQTAIISLELSDVTSCSNDMPASSGVTFSSITVRNTAGSDVSVAWTPYPATGSYGPCNANVSSYSDGYPTSVALAW